MRRTHLKERYRITINGIVQGVGFRPYIYQLARDRHLAGWVANSSWGVVIEAEGEGNDCQTFIAAIPLQAPALSRIDCLEREQISPLGESSFKIMPSLNGTKQTLISPDMGICRQCLSEIRDVHNRRYRYSFTNCTNCGPRFTIIRDLPYDRALTTMADFCQCDLCQGEFDDPQNRRFHAQPNACADCGPVLSYFDNGGRPIPGDSLLLAKDDIKKGKILAVKGLGGYHLVCDAANNQAVNKLRNRKLRYDKPFALMMPDIETAARYCLFAQAEEALLASPRRPIVLLEKRPQSSLLAKNIAPGNGRLGIMLPYTPLHYLLMEDFEALVMTSANLSDEPIVYESEQLLNRLGGIVDSVLTHDRKIFRRCDDSVLAHAAGGQLMLRRARGFVPETLPISACAEDILAVGAEQKNTFCLSRGEHAFLSQHIGELDNQSTYQSFCREIDDFQRMFDIKPRVIAYDMHPDYLSSDYARKQEPSLIKIPVQHHHAHLASVLAEHQLQEPVIGLIYDGTGYGPNHSLWGGEVLVGDLSAYQRRAHLLPIALPGGEQAIWQPWRMAMSALAASFGSENVEQAAPQDLLPTGWEILLLAMNSGLNAPLSSGMGRLFDAVAALLDMGRYITYEGQAAIALEQAIVDTEDKDGYRFAVLKEQESYIMDWRDIIRQIVTELAAGIDKGLIAQRFHRAVVEVSREIVLMLRLETGINKVALSGGCWQNIYLLELACKKLKAEGFEVFFNQAVPINDGGIAYGQAAIAAMKINKGEF